MRYLEAVYRGRLKMLQAMGGKPVASSSPVAEPEPIGPPMTSNLFRAMFGKK